MLFLLKLSVHFAEQLEVVDLFIEVGACCFRIYFLLDFFLFSYIVFFLQVLQQQMLQVP